MICPWQCWLSLWIKRKRSQRSNSHQHSNSLTLLDKRSHPAPMLQLLMVSFLFILVFLFFDVIRTFSESFLPNSYILSPFPEMGTFCKSFVVRYLGHKEIKDSKSEI